MILAFAGKSFRISHLALILTAWSWLHIGGMAQAQLDFESEPINYETAPTTDRIFRLQQQLEKGEVQLQHDDQHGYLKSVLQQLEVPIASQVLVFSKTSFQLRQINPRTPRAVYFNDDVYVGFVQDGDVVELSVADPQQGGIFYTLSQEAAERPEVVRDRGQCISCHASSRTSGVPGHLVRSVYSSRSGQPFFGSGTYTSDHRSPLSERFGGWYVTGTHGRQRHMGNVLATNKDRPEELDVESGANVTCLDEIVDTKPYLSPHSDIVALMVLQHQSKMHNLITRANYETRSSLHYDTVMNKALDRPADYRSESSQRRIDSAAEKLVEYLLFAEEYALTDPIVGTSGFAEEFAAQGPFDSQGRSLRQFDLKTRMMKYPCSYLIYSESFDGLPREVKSVIYEKLHDVLSGKDNSEMYQHLSAQDRTAIKAILKETKPDLPSDW
ncbi:MAG: hypothetical protein R3C28_13205 [Pirellulaceae bacterium]